MTRGWHPKLFVLCLKHFRWLAYVHMGGRAGSVQQPTPFIISFCAAGCPSLWGGDRVPDWVRWRCVGQAFCQMPQCFLNHTTTRFQGKDSSWQFSYSLSLYIYLPFPSGFVPLTVTNGTSHSPTALNGAPSPPNGFSNGPSSSSSSSLANQQLPPACGARQLSKLKRFLTTLQQFGNDISPEIGERVRTLVLGLVVSKQKSVFWGKRQCVG